MPQVSAKQIVKNDYWAFLLAIGGPILVIVAVIALTTGVLPRVRRGHAHQIGPAFAAAMCVVTVAVAAMLLVLLVRRIRCIRRILRDGSRVAATVTDVWWYKDRGRIEYRYTHEEAAHKSGTAVMKNALTEDISPGDEIEVAVDPMKPRRALMLFIYEPQPAARR